MNPEHAKTPANQIAGVLIKLLFYQRLHLSLGGLYHPIAMLVMTRL